jgi:NADH-quinone oxidoreductase subunit C
VSAFEKETALLDRLHEKFPAIDTEKATVATRRLYVQAPSESFMDVLKYLKGVLKFDHLCTITGLDAGDGFEFLYHIANAEGVVVSLKLKTPSENAVVQSILPIFNGATFYEREIHDILGVTVEGLPEGRRYPLPESCPDGQYPLRKSWKPEALKENSKEG